MSTQTEALRNGDGSTATFTFPFEYLEESDVKVEVGGVLKTQNTHYTFSSLTEITFTSGNIPASGTGNIRIYRLTNTDELRNEFFAGSAIRAQDLNDDFLQNLYRVQEISERAVDGTGDTMTGDLTMNNANIVFEGATADDHETTLTVTDPTADRTITLPNVTGTVVTTGDTNTVTGAMIANDAINGDRIADDSINSEHYVDGSIDTAHIADAQITTAKLADSNVTTAKLAADAVNGTKIADDSINSEHYVDGSIDTAHIADAQITTAKIADDAVTSAKIATGAVGADELAATSVTAGSYTAADITVDADGRITSANSGAIATGEITDGAVTTAKLADNAVTTAKITDANVTSAKLAGDAVTGAKIADDSIDSEHYVDGSIDTAHLADQQVTAGKLATNAVTTAKINADAITNAKIADDAVQAENINGLTASITELNQLDGNTLSNSNITWTSGTTFPSAAQISNRLAEFGGFEAIADDESFPNTAPAEGVIISIANAGGLTVNGSGVSTNGDTLNDTTVTINNFPSGFNSTTLDDGIGLLVVATSTAHTYNFHRVVAKNEDVRQLSSDINDFKARYRIGSSNPTSDNDEGDLFYNTGSDKMLVYDGSAWEEVQSIGEFFIIPSTDFPTWNGTINDISITNNAPANAEQIVLSINGVIQEPNDGTGRPTDGFSLNGSTIQLSAAPAAGSDAWGVIIGSTVNIGTPSAGTVGTTQLADGGVTTAKLAADAVDGTKLADDSVNSEHYVDGSIDTAHIADSQVTQAKIANEAINEARLQVSNTPTNGQFLSAQSGNTGGLTWATVSTATPTLQQVLDAGNTSTTDIIFNDANGSAIAFDASQGSAVFNDQGQADGDFRVESDTNTHMLFVDAGNNRVGIGTSAPTSPLDVTGDIQVRDATGVNHFIQPAGNTIFNDRGLNVDFRVEGDTDENLFFVDGGTDRVGIGRNNPGRLLDVDGSSFFRGQLQIVGGNDLAWANTNNNQTVAINADDATETYNMTLPPTRPTAANRFLAAAGTGTGADQELEWTAPAGTVLQCRQLAFTSRFSASSGQATWTDVTGFKIDFTPQSATSTIIISVSLGRSSGSSNSSAFKVIRDTTDVMVGDAVSSAARSGFTNMGSGSFSGNHAYGNHWTGFEASPGTSQVEYQLQYMSQGNATTVINQSASNDQVNDSYGSTGSSSMVIWEIEN